MNTPPANCFTDSPAQSFSSGRFLVLTAATLVALASWAGAADSEAGRWWKGNLHTHTLWSDGDDYPEMVTAWYQDHGYEFLGISDHNRLLTGERWTDAGTNRGGAVALDKYVKRFGGDWVGLRESGGQKLVRLKTLAEFRGKFEKPGSFLLIESEEITANYEQVPVHINATHLRELIPPQGGNSVFEVIQNNVTAVLDQRQRTGQPMVPNINHPNFLWALTAEEMMRVQGNRFLEIYNGHPITKDPGDATHAGTERLWDVVLTWRLHQMKQEPIWGTAVDDAHSYHKFAVGEPNPGRGWLMVRAARLTPETLIAAMEAGDFYATTGVRLKDVRRADDRIAVEIDAEPGETYTTQFNGTRAGYDPTNEPVRGPDGKPLRTTRRYSKDVGAVLAEVKGPNPSFTLKGDEIYVRATVVSSKSKANPAFAGDLEKAWVQPVIPRRDKSRP